MRTVVSCNCYQRAPLTKLCLPYALAHAGMDALWLLSDDGSTDDTAKFLRRFESPKITVRCHPKNRGHYVLRNEAFEFALAHNADVIINIDNDILLPQNWLRDLVHAFAQSDFGIGSAWIVNDKTLTKMIQRRLATPLSSASLHTWVNTQGCGGACIAHRRSVIDAGCRYDTSRTLFTFGDSHFNGQALRKGFKVGVYLGVQCWHLQTFTWPNVEYERRKLKLRHLHVRGSMQEFEKSYLREWNKTLESQNLQCTVSCETACMTSDEVKK